MTNDPADTEKVTLELNRLSFRAHLSEVLLIRLAYFHVGGIQRLSPEAAARAVSALLDQVGQIAQEQLFSEAVFDSASDAKKAMYADEIYEMTERLKQMIPKS